MYHFSKQYLTPPEYWEHCLNYIKSYNPMCYTSMFYIPMFHGTFKKLQRDIIKHAYYHLYLNKKWSWSFYWGSNYLKLDYFHRPVINWHLITIYERELCYPHNELKLCLREFEQQTSKLPPKDLYKRCEEMMALYPKIQAAISDIDEWFQLLLKANDDKYLKDN
uniref:Uncharacterized protein n=1 Tax=Panagrolaimus sp. PS1159 TaxID=55785 RepID=A0AC35G9L7_9BILA